MARSPEFWESVQLDYEVNSISYDKLSKKHGVSKSTIITRSKKEGWVKGKTDQIIEDKILLEKKKIELSTKTDQLKPTEQKAVLDAVQHELEMEGIYQEFDKAIMTKATRHVGLIKDDDDQAGSKLVQFSTVRKNISPKSIEQAPTNQTQVNLQNNIEVPQLVFNPVSADGTT